MRQLASGRAPVRGRVAVPDDARVVLVLVEDVIAVRRSVVVRPGRRGDHAMDDDVVGDEVGAGDGTSERAVGCGAPFRCSMYAVAFTAQ